MLWTKEPDQFTLNPLHQMPGQTTRARAMALLNAASLRLAPPPVTLMIPQTQHKLVNRLPRFLPILPLQDGAPR
jgi:hypothetical protein